MNATLPMTALPTRAGPVEIKFLEDVNWPVRPRDWAGKYTNTLIFPTRYGLKCYPLKGGEQFLLLYPSRMALQKRIVFMGFDESAFLTGVNQVALDAFLQGGEEAYFAALRPTLINQLAMMFPSAPFDRQGDIWYFALPYSWDELVKRKYICVRSCRKRARVLENKMHPVLETNHFLHGKYLPACDLEFNGRIISGLTLAEGTLQTGDHADRKLDGPHVLARTPNIEPRPIDNPGYWD